MSQTPSTLRWEGGPEGTLWLLDQTLLPGEVREIACRSLESVERAIKTLQVRGAPAIGIAAAYGVCVGLQSAAGESREAFFERLGETIAVLAASRPTAVNLFMALERLESVANRLRGAATNSRVLQALWEEACKIHDEDRAMCRAIGRHGAALMPLEGGVLTHCNAGGLATAEYGTALAVLFSAHESGKRLQVYVDETRPLLQGARLTAWELVARRIPATLICDNMAAQVMAEGRIQAVVVGADRIAANGDAANKIGTYGVAVLAQAHGIPFYVAAPATTFDLKLADGGRIPIEQRSADEVTHHGGKRLAPEGVQVYNPAFDVTPARLIAALVTDRGVVQPVTRENIARVLRG